MLTRLELRSFKVYDKLDISLAPFNVIVGTNGAGKTTLLQAVEFMASLVTGTIDEELETRTCDSGGQRSPQTAGTFLYMNVETTTARSFTREQPQWEVYALRSQSCWR
jgi:predicted ATPase